MLNIIGASRRIGRVTTAYPDGDAIAPCRGRPAIDPARCNLARCGQEAACATACPSGAITISRTHRLRRWRLDLAQCVFCARCAESCPSGAIAMTADFELATRARDELIVELLLEDRRETELRGIDDWAHDEHALAAPRATVRLGGRVARRLRRSLHVRHMAAGSDNSTDWEIAALLNPVYDIQRFGIDFVASPRHADLLLVTGSVTRHLEPALHATYEAMPAPRLVVAAGSEACGGGVLRGSYAVAGPVDRCLPVDVYITGDPPRPQALIHGLLMAMGRLEPRMKRMALRSGRD